MNRRKALYFIDRGKVEVREEPIPAQNSNSVTVRTEFSAISAGTELLLYRKEIPETLARDESISSLPGTFAYPLKYGYSTVGKVIDTGAQVDRSWRGRHVFSFHPHESHFTTTIDELFAVPDSVSTADALFFPNMETAVTLVIDGSPTIGEQIAIFGQGIVGLLTTAHIARLPGVRIITFDHYQKRREASVKLGAWASIDPDEPDAIERAQKHVSTQAHSTGTDLTYEISGNSDALQQAINMTGFGGRIVIGSWYGTKPVTLDLGTRFHRQRISLQSSQVSTLAPPSRTRWTKRRRASLTWHMLSTVQPAQHFITHTCSIDDAGRAFALLDRQPETALQVILAYPS